MTPKLLLFLKYVSDILFGVIDLDARIAVWFSPWQRTCTCITCCKSVTEHKKISEFKTNSTCCYSLCTKSHTRSRENIAGYCPVLIVSPEYPVIYRGVSSVSLNIYIPDSSKLAHWQELLYIAADGSIKSILHSPISTQIFFYVHVPCFFASWLSVWIEDKSTLRNKGNSELRIIPLTHK